LTNKFHERFGIHVDAGDAKMKFVNRIRNRVFLSFALNSGLDHWDLCQPVAERLGMEYDHKIKSDAPIADYTEKDFHKTLEAVEAVYETVSETQKSELSDLILKTLSDAEVDLGIRWEGGLFLPSGAKLLDDDLVDASLRWLSAVEYTSVQQPFSKGLNHFAHAEKRPELLADTVTDMYEAVEALAKVETGRDRDLSANAELFIKAVRASDHFKVMLKDYVAYANHFRHATKTRESKPNLTSGEVEAFMYLTGIFIRLAMRSHQ